MVSHHLAMFDGHWCKCIYTILIILINITCHVTLRNHVIERSSNFMSGNSSRNITTFPSLVAVAIVVVGM